MNIPTKDEFRGAWILEGGAIKLSSAKAKEISLGRMRAQRVGEFAKLTVRAEQGEDVTLQREALRESTDPLKSLLMPGIVTLNDIRRDLAPLELLPVI